MENNHDQQSNTGDATIAEPSTASLAALQSSEQRELMDLVDRLRRSGLSSMLQLPQIVVCGDQSSGKSSVLEAITEIPFPRKESLCTRFATEIVMRRGETRAISCKINPDKNRPSSEQSDLLEFHRTIEDFNQLPMVIEEATKVMGLGSDRAFSRDVLSVEISGLKHPQMTLVDLPGLIHSSSKAQSEEDIAVIKGLVNEYISEKRTIVLAVISAKNDYANQIILERCREFDAKGARTLGIITKPDFLRPGTENETSWLDLAQNKDIHFKLGWHILKNRSDEEHSLSFLERNIKEAHFLSKGNYRKLPKRMKGIDSLRQRLSLLLFNHLKKELPGFRRELDTMAEDTVREIQTLGQARSTLPEQRLFLAELFTSAWDILRRGYNGDYDHKFFGRLNLKQTVVEGQNARRLRAVVQSLNMDFADNIRIRGRTFQVEEVIKAKGSATDISPADNISGDLKASADEFAAATWSTTKSKIKNKKKSVVYVDDIWGDFETKADESAADARQLSKSKIENKEKSTVCADEELPEIKRPTNGNSEHNHVEVPEKLSKADEMDHVIGIMERSRGRELFGTFNPLLVSYLFQEQSFKWEKIARAHVSVISQACETFVLAVLDFVSTRGSKRKLVVSVIQPSLKLAHEAATKELDQIILDKSRHAITYNHYFTDTLQKLQQKRRAKLMTESTKAATVSVNVHDEYGNNNGARNYISPDLFQQNLNNIIEPDMSKFSAEQMIDAHDAFYKDEMKYFIGVVTKQVVERHLVATLAQVLSPTALAQFSDKQIADLASEPSESIRLREQLTAKLKMLEEGQAMFVSIAGSY